jgi:hypothetical protein
VCCGVRWCSVECGFERVGGTRARTAERGTRGVETCARWGGKEKAASTNKRRPWERDAERDARVVKAVQRLHQRCEMALALVM